MQCINHTLCIIGGQFMSTEHIDLLQQFVDKRSLGGFASRGEQALNIKHYAGFIKTFNSNNCDIAMFRVRTISSLFSTQIGQQQNNMKRFYKEAHLGPNPQAKHPLHKHLLMLDGRTIKTPYQNPLAIPSQKLGFLVVNQFNRQHKFIKSGEMPLLALSRTAVDADIEGHLSPHLHHSVYEYLKTDTLLFPDEAFKKEYKQLVEPLLAFFEKRFNMKLQPSNSIIPPGVTISLQFKQWLQSLNSWQLIGVEQMVTWMRSTIAGVALAHEAAHPLLIQRAAYLQEQFQMRSSGQVQEKLMEINQIRLMVSCGQIMYKFGKLDAE